MAGLISIVVPLLATFVVAEPEPQGPYGVEPSPTSYGAPPLTVTGTYQASTPAPTSAATTSLTGIPSYSSASPYSTLSYNTTSTAPPYPTGSGNSSLPACRNVQYNFANGQAANATRAAAIVELYQYAWDGFKKYALPDDELLPLTEAGIDDWYGWGVTVVDGIDTAIIMGLTDIVAEQLAYIETIDFNTTPYGPVEIFDTNIRYVGGLLSAYDLLNSGMFYNDYPKSQIDALLSQAVSLADKIAFGFDTPTGLASVDVNFTSDQPVVGTYQIGNTTYNATNTASTGTFILEWARLSDLTGNDTYRALTERAESYLVNPSPAPAYPGLVGTEFDIDTGKMLTFDGGWHAGVDSFLEYLIKIYQYQQTPTTTQYKNFWLEAAQSTMEHILVAPYGFPDLKFLSELDVNGSIALSEDHFSCFAGGNFFLGGAFLDMSELTGMGVAVTDSCHQAYNQTLTGLGPIGWAWYNSSNLAYNFADDNDAAERKMAAKTGFFIPDGDENWESRPEEIESIFYGHRITGDPRWAEYNWQIAEAINATARNNIAFATVNNVNEPFGGSMSNNLDSFFFAEVLKYLYLSFTEADVIDLKQWVFNTEAHPFLVQCGIGAIDDDSYVGPVNGTGTGTGSMPSGTASPSGYGKFRM